MSFAGDGARLIGEDGKLMQAAAGAEIAGDGSTPLPVGVYLVAAVAGTSSFPANTTGDAIAAGDILQVDTGVTITPAVGDDVITLALTDKGDLSSWGMDFSKEEIDTTVLTDDTKKYRAGMSDMTGSMSGIFVVGETDDPAGGLREFIPIVRQDGSTSYDRYDQQESILIGFFYVNEDVNLADVQYVVAPYQQYGIALGGEIGSAQTFESSFRFATKTITHTTHGAIPINPTFYRQGT